MHRRVLLRLQRAELTGDPKVSTACDTASGQEKRAPLRVQKSEKTHHCLCAVDAAPQQQFAMHATAPPARRRTFCRYLLLLPTSGRDAPEASWTPGQGERCTGAVARPHVFGQHRRSASSELRRARHVPTHPVADQRPASGETHTRAHEPSLSRRLQHCALSWGHASSPS